MLVSAKRAGIFDAVAPVIRALEESGLYIAPAVVKAILESVDETVVGVEEVEGLASGSPEHGS